jgi:hypothetical protein
MLCRRGRLISQRMLGRLWNPGECFAATGSLAPSLVDTLLPRVCWPNFWRMVCRRCCWMLVLWVDALPPRLCLCIGNHCIVVSFFSAGSIDRFRVVEAVALNFSFSRPYVYSRSLTTCSVVCNLCYEGSLVVVPCNSLCLIKNELYSLIAKKKEKKRKPLKMNQGACRMKKNFGLQAC